MARYLSFAFVCIAASSASAQGLLLEARAGALYQIEQGSSSGAGLAAQAAVGIAFTPHLAVTGTGTFGTLSAPRLTLTSGGAWEGQSVWMASFDVALRVTLFPSWNVNPWVSLGTGISRGNGNVRVSSEPPEQFEATLNPRGASSIPKIVAAAGVRIRLLGPLLLNASLELRTSDFEGVTRPQETIESGSSMVAITAGPMLLF